jgi:hypothetical protein
MSPHPDGGIDLRELEEMFGNPADDADMERAAFDVLAARAVADAAEQDLTVAKAVLAASEDTLLAKMQKCKAKSVLVDNYRLTAAETTHYAPPADALADAGFYKWLLLSGGGDLVKRYVNRTSFGKFCRGLVSHGKGLHPRIKSVVQKVVSITRLNGENS